jgi:nitric oxide reductase NorD protein
MADDSSRDELFEGLLKRFGGVGVTDAAELMVLARDRIRKSPVEHAKAATDVTRALADAKKQLPSGGFEIMRRSVLLVARRDWTAAAVFAEALIPLVRAHPDSVDWVAEAIARAVQADRSLARQLAGVLPDCATRVEERGPRLRIVTALADLCRRHPGLGLAALPSVRLLLDEGNPEGLATFLEDALERAARSESVARSFLLRESRAGQEAWDSRREGLLLADVSRSLQLYAEAHLGSGVRIRSMGELPGSIPLDGGAIAVTDGTHIFLVPRLDRFDDDESNFRLYKVAVAHEVGRIEFGTFKLQPWSVPGIDPIELYGQESLLEPGQARRNPVLEFIDRFPDPDLARRVFLFAEDLRVDACLRRSYVGLARDLEAMADVDRAGRPDLDSYKGADLLLEMLARWLWFGEELPEGDVYKRFHEASWLLQALRHPGANVQDSAGASSLLYSLVGGVGEPRREGASGDPEASPYETALEALEGGGRGGASMPGDFEDQDSPEQPGGVADAPAGERFFTGGLVDDVTQAEEDALRERAEQIQRSLDSRGVAVSLREIKAALEVDLEVADQVLERKLLEAFRDGLRRGVDGGDNEETLGFGPGQAPPGVTPGVEVSRYEEWDAQIGDYRPRWTSVWERTAAGDASAFVDSVLAEHGPMVRRLRREFQMLRPTGLGKERRAREGDEVDLDALVEDLVDRSAGHPSEGRVYLRRRRSERDVAVAFLVDLSASTRESVGETGKSVIEVEKESLVMMSEALEALGDRYAIFGFSGRGRQMVTFDVFKDFEDRLDQRVRGRIGAMTYRMENRDGAAIRHATKRLCEIEASTRLLILLSDGKPLDCGCDVYQGNYAHADTRMALREALEAKVNPFCITVDPEGEEYLRDLYGEVRYAVIDSVAELPSRLPAIYKRLTT